MFPCVSLCAHVLGMFGHSLVCFLVFHCLACLACFLARVCVAVFGMPSRACVYRTSEGVIRRFRQRVGVRTGRGAAA